MAVIKIVPFPGPKGDPGEGGSGNQIIPLPDFLTYVEGRAQLPVLNQNFGWNSHGMFFGPTAQSAGSDVSYPIFTNFTIPQTSAVHVEFDMTVKNDCNDTGMAIYVDGTVPVWNFGTDLTRIAAQFNCPMPELNGLTVQGTLDEGDIGLQGDGTYRFVFDYNPNAEGDKATFAISYNETEVTNVSINEVLPDGAYRVGFAADNDNGRSYISNLAIVVDPGTEGEVVYGDTLTNGNSGATPDLILPLSILNADGDDVITFEQSYTGTARIVAPQDDLALRSARDILLYPGDDGPGKVYIGWGDDSMNAGASNAVATIGDIPSLPTETSFVVAGGTAGTQPTFDGDPLFSGSYVKAGPMVHFQIQVLFDNINSFGSGQYYVDLPFPAKYGYQMRNGCIHDTSNGNQWAITGHVLAGESRVNLFYSAGSGQDEIFDYNSPFVLQTVDKFHISGDYIALEGV